MSNFKMSIFCYILYFIRNKRIFPFYVFDYKIRFLFSSSSKLPVPLWVLKLSIYTLQGMPGPHGRRLQHEALMKSLSFNVQSFLLFCLNRIFRACKKASHEGKLLEVQIYFFSSSVCGWGCCAAALESIRLWRFFLSVSSIFSILVSTYFSTSVA